MENPAFVGSLEFRVSLVHHHPLPVVSTEYFRSNSVFDLSKASSGNIKDTIDVFQAEPGTVFKNAGTFLYGALNTDVDLILHGHQHHSWFSQVRYPATTHANEHKLLVAGAASIGEMTNGKCKYNLIRLHRNGNITIEERSREHNPPGYTVENSLKLYTDSELRLTRIFKARNNLKDKYVEGYSVLKYNIAQAELVLRRTEIQRDSSADYQVTYYNLHATKDKVGKLIIASEYPKGAYAAKPTVVMNEKDYKVKIEKEQSNRNDTYTWAINFTPPLSTTQPVTLTIKYQIFNAFDFVKEYHRARTNKEVSEEEEGYIARLIIPERLVQTVSFPEQWRPYKNPSFSVENENGELDEDEKRYHQNALEYIENKGVVTISIDRPIPGYCYKMVWPLDDLANYENQLYDEALLNKVHDLSSVQLDHEIETQCYSILKYLHGKYSTLFKKNTELSLFVVKNKSKGFENRAIEIALQRFGFYGPKDSPMIDIREHTAGSGLIGLAYRSGKTQTVSRNNKEMIGYEFDNKISNKHHWALWCIPLHVPSDSKIDVSRSPIYAVICAGSFENNGSLFKGDKSFGQFEDEVKTKINEDICRILEGAKQS